MATNLRIMWIALLCVSTTAWAVKPSEWVHQTEAELSKGELEQTVVTSRGRVELSRASVKLAELDGEDSIIYDMMRIDADRWLLAVGPEAKLVTFDDGAEEGERVTVVAELEDEQIFSMTRVDDNIMIAVSGGDCRIELRSTEDWSVVHEVELPGVRYVWDVLVVQDRLWVATGTEGQVLVIDDEGQPWKALDTEQDNVLCLGADGQGRVYAGTDGEGLVYRLTPKADMFVAPEIKEDEDADDDADDDEDEDGDEDGEEDEEEEAPEFVAAAVTSYVVYDANEPEIGALLVLDDGTVYAGTADADQAKTGRLEAAKSKRDGRPDDEPDEGADDAGEADAVTDDAADGATDTAAADGAATTQPSEADAADGATGGDATADAATGDAADDTVATEDGDAAEDGEPVKVADAGTTPTPEQYEELRGMIKERLVDAREGKVLTVKPTAAKSKPGGSAVKTDRKKPAKRPSSRGKASKGGNAIYQIDPDGFVQQVFRESVMILRIGESDGILYVATGNDGQLYRVDPAQEETAALLDLEAQQIPAMDVDDAGRVVLGTANPGLLITLADSYTGEGTITSPVLDASHVSQWGRLRISAQTPAGTGVTVQTRAGNVGDPDAGSWTEWTEAQAVRPRGPAQPVALPVENDPARFIQYRVTLTSAGAQTPSVLGVALKYQMPNLRPKIASVTAAYAPAKSSKPGSGGPAPKTTLKLKWEAKDGNGDQMRYKLEYRGLDEGDVYILLAEDHKTATYDWDTRTAPDGRYELRVTASDMPDNVPDEVLTTRRLSDPFIIDNTTPDMDRVLVEAGGAPGTVRVSVTVSDDLSEVAELRYQVSGEETWEIVMPTDDMYDSTSERMTFIIDDLSAGTRVVTLRATDALGNSRYVSEAVRVR